MDELTRALRIISERVGENVTREAVSEESVVVTPDELDANMLSSVLIQTLPKWVIVDMFALYRKKYSYMVYFVRASDGKSDRS